MAYMQHLSGILDFGMYMAIAYFLSHDFCGAINDIIEVVMLG